MSGTRAISTTPRRELSSSSFFLQGKEPKEIHAILTETLGCFLPDRAKDLLESLYYPVTEFFLSTRSQEYLVSDFMEPPGLYPCTEQSLCQLKSIHFFTLFI